MTGEEALKIAEKTFRQFYPELPANGEYKAYLNFGHLYGETGKTWVVDYCIQDADGDISCLYEAEIIDKKQEILTVYSAYEIDMPDYVVKDGIVL